MRYSKSLIFICFVICSAKGYSQNNKHWFFIKADSLILNVGKCDSINLVTQYYKWNNFNIPKYYVIKDSLEIGINDDKEADKILILSPRFQEYEVSEINCDENINNRLLLFF